MSALREAEAIQMLRRERDRRIKRVYDLGGWLVARETLDIEVEGEPLRIPAGHKLTRDQALSYPGDTKRVYEIRPSKAMARRMKLC
jgi:hypothetical protein